MNVLLKMKCVFGQLSLLVANRISRQVAVCVTAAVISFSSAVSADDTEIFFSGKTTAPNVLFIIDASESMIQDNNKIGDETLMQVMKDVLSGVIRDTSNMNIGLMKFTNGNNAAPEPTRLLTEIGSVDSLLHKADFLLELNAIPGGGSTPTVEALEYAMQYFDGELPRVPFDWYYKDDLRDIPSSEPRVPAPPSGECGENHIVLLTDGAPTEDKVGGEVARIERLINRSCNLNPMNRADGLAKGACGEELAAYMYNEKNIKIHTIGMNFNQPWLRSIAENGGNGLYASASDEQGFATGLKNALASVFESFSATFAAPTVSPNSFNESRHRDELFYSQFQPQNSVRWEGNVKKYRITEEGMVVDKENKPLLDNAGQIDPETTSLWSTNYDGEQVKMGGFAAKLPAYGQRNWFTDFDVEPVNSVITPKKITIDNYKDELTQESVGATSEDEFEEVVSWGIGADVEGSVENSNSHQYVAEALHSSPTLLSYWADSANNTRSEVLFTGNNMGVLHALDADTGRQLWSYTPSEHLPSIKKYLDNATTTTEHVYGLDGGYTVQSTRAETTDYDYEVDEAWLYLTERRGGNRVYALDVSRGNEETDPFKVMWKITGGLTDAGERHDFSDLAQTWSKPQMITVRYGCADDVNCPGKELLMFGGGYNPLYDDVDLEYRWFIPPDSGHGNAVYLVDPKTGELVWSVGNGEHHDLNLPIHHSVPSTPVPLDYDLDGYVNVLMFPDIAGNIWRVDLNQTAERADELHHSGGQIAALSPPRQNLRFFNRLDVSVSSNSYSTAFYNLVLGSGMRSSPLHEEPDLNNLFGIKDRFVFETPHSEDPREAYQYVEDAFGRRDIIRAPNDLRDVSDDRSSVSSEYGFYMPLESGEKILQPTLIYQNNVFSVSYVPPDDTSRDPCESPIGTSRLYVNNLPDGSPRDIEVEDENGDVTGVRYLTLGDGILSGPQLIDTGGVGAPLLLIDKNAMKLVDLLNGESPVVFRKFWRTGWLESDGYDE